MKLSHVHQLVDRERRISNGTVTHVRLAECQRRRTNERSHRLAIGRYLREFVRDDNEQ